MSSREAEGEWQFAAQNWPTAQAEPSGPMLTASNSAPPGPGLGLNGLALSF